MVRGQLAKQGRCNRVFILSSGGARATSSPRSLAAELSGSLPTAIRASPESVLRDSAARYRKMLQLPVEHHRMLPRILLTNYVQPCEIQSHRRFLPIGTGPAFVWLSHRESTISKREAKSYE